MDKALLGGVSDHLRHIVKERPQIIALGYDQSAYVKGLKSSLAAKGLKVRVVRLKPFYPKIYKSSLAKQNQKFDKK